MAWRRLGDKPLSGSMMISLLTHICITWPQWVKKPQQTLCAMLYSSLSVGIDCILWWRHQMETFSALLAICAGNSSSPVNSPHKGRWRGALMFSLICAWMNDWVSNRDLRRHRIHYDVTVMSILPWLKTESCHDANLISSSLVAPELVKTTTSGITSAKIIAIMQQLVFS